MIEFTGPLYNLLQHFTNHYLRLDILDLWPHYTNPLLCNYSYFQMNCQLKVKVTLRLTVGQSVSQSVSLGVEAHLGLMTRFLLLFRSYGLVFVKRPLWREDGCLLYMLLALASTVFLGSEPLGLATIFYCLRFETNFSSPPTTRRITVEVFDPAPTRAELSVIFAFSLYRLGSDLTKNTSLLHIRWSVFT
jgi:hypothetical protein